jgi:CubicO group peptidase (beta-lactamase class C family)
MSAKTLTTAKAQANLSNWRNNPYSHWAFHHIRDIIPCADIPAAGGKIWELPPAAQTLDNFALPIREGRHLSLDEVLQTTATDAFVVLLDGRVVHESYGNGMTAQTPHILMSATKSVTGLLAGILQQRGELNVDALVSHYVPEIAATPWQEATVRQLLDMRTGIVLDAQEQHAYEVATRWSPAAPGEEQGDMHSFFQAMKPGTALHGGAFKYVSANTDLLGWVIERATGSTVAQLVSELLWQPLGAEADACITVDAKGAPRCTGGMCATARDFARLGQLVVQNGARDGAEIIPAAWLADIEQNGDREAWNQGEFAQSFGGATMSYRSSWYVLHRAPTLLFAMGIHGQNLFVDRVHKLVVAKLSSQNDAIDPHASALAHRAVAEIRRCLFDPPR